MTTEKQKLTMEMVREIETSGRFWSKVDRSGGPDSCWIWTHGTNKFCMVNTKSWKHINA